MQLRCNSSKHALHFLSLIFDLRKIRYIIIILSDLTAFMGYKNTGTGNFLFSFINYPAKNRRWVFSTNYNHVKMKPIEIYCCSRSCRITDLYVIWCQYCFTIVIVNKCSNSSSALQCRSAQADMFIPSSLFIFPTTTQWLTLRAIWTEKKKKPDKLSCMYTSAHCSLPEL